MTRGFRFRESSSRDPSHLERTLFDSRTPEAQEILPNYDPKCYLCPGNSRAQGDINPNYENTFVFDNDFSAVEPNPPDYKTEVSGKVFIFLFYWQIPIKMHLVIHILPTFDAFLLFTLSRVINLFLIITINNKN